MDGQDDKHTRICILEKMFAVFQESQIMHMQKEEVSFDKLGAQLSAIFRKMDTMQAEQREEDARVITQLRATLDRDFVSKQGLELKLAEVKNQLSQQIGSSKTSIFTEVFRIVAAVTLSLTLSGWIYVNILK